MNAGSIEYRITGDSSGLNNALNNVSSTANNAAQSIVGAANATGSITANATQANNVLTATATAANNAAQSIVGAANAAGNITGNAGQANSALAATAAAAAQTASNVNDIARAAQNVDRSTEAAANNGALKKIGDTAKKAASATLKIVGAATTAAAGTVAALAKSAVESYAEYEQLVGGVETLFKDSANVVQGYADEAYKTAGLSANAYMETVTGFSASLIQGLGGDTGRAAEAANTAITDMADNANKMGTDMQSIQNAYQGFAKQNYTMLDNLKLGYGGTKEEMQRLLTEAEKLSGTKFDISNFADIVEAIHVIQTDMKISGLTAQEAAEAVAKGVMTEKEAFEAMGTTAKEASTTIQGSIGMLSSAWTNFLTGAADPTQDFNRLLQNVVDSFLTVTDNLMPRIQAVLPQLAEGLEGLVNGILPQIPEMINKTLPEVLKGADSIIQGLLDALTKGIKTAGPIISESAPVIVKTLVDGIRNALPELATAAVEIVGELLKAILDNAGDVTQGAVDIITALADGLTKALPELVPAAVEAVTKIVQTLLLNVPELIDAAGELITALADGLMQSEQVLIDQAPVIIADLITALVEGIPEVVEFAIKLCERIAKNIEEYGWRGLGDKIVDGIMYGDMDYAETAAEKQQQEVSKYVDYTRAQIDELKKIKTQRLGEINGIYTDYTNGIIGYDDLPEWVHKRVDAMGDYVSVTGDAAEDILIAEIEGIESEIPVLEKAWQSALDVSTEGGAEWLAAEEERRRNAQAVFEKYGIGGARSANPDETFGVNTATLEDELETLENLYATHKVTEEEYWAGRKAILEKYRDDNDPEWWKLYDKVTDHYDKLAETEAKAAEKAAKEAKQAEEKAERERAQAARDYENSIKDSISDKFRELETEQLEKGYDDSWLLEQKRAFLETLDHNSEAYKDYNLKLLKEQQSADNRALKEAQTAADKAKKEIKQSYDSVVKSRDSLASSLGSSGDLFKTSEETDKRTGEKKKSQSIGIDDFKKKVEAKKKLTSKVAELLENDMPMDMVKQLLKQDPEAALKYAEDLLKSPKKLSELKKAYAEDEDVSNILANMVTESSDEFKELGSEAGDMFGESFMEAFKANWEEAFKSVFDDNYLNEATVSVSAANASAGNTVTAPVSSAQIESSETARTGAKTSLQQGMPVYKVVDLNGQYLAKVVRQENKQYSTIGGG